jgi:nucleotide-binding universal stress UspA family protein
MKKILVPIDFSDNAADALHFAIQLNEKLKGKITLLHVLEVPLSTFNAGGEMNLSHAEIVFQKQLLEGTQQKLHEWADKVRSAGQEVAVKMEFGNPYKSIAKDLTDEGADWIVMGSKGASGLKEVFLGSNAERVVRHSDCPVFVIKGPTRLSDMKNMVFASSLDAEQDHMVPKVKEIQQLLGLNVHVIRVKTPHNFLTEHAAREQLDAFEKRTGMVNNTLNTIEADYPDEGIVAFAEKIKTGLIVMGTHGRSGLAHFFGGSQAEDVVNHSKIPVLTFKIKE